MADEKNILNGGKRDVAAAQERSAPRSRRAAVVFGAFLSLAPLMGCGAAQYGGREATDSSSLASGSSVPELVGMLKNPDPKVRKDAACGIGEYARTRPGDKEVLKAVQPLVAALKDPDVEVRCCAAGGLGDIGEPSANPALIAALKDPDSDVGRFAAGSLGATGDASVVPILVDELRRNDGSITWGVMMGLERMGAPAVPYLIQVLGDENKEVGDTAKIALGYIGVPSIVPLMHAIRDGDNTVKKRAAWAIGKVAVDNPKEPQVKIAAPLMIREMENEDPGVRQSMEGALGHMGDVFAIPYLVKATKDEDLGVRKDAIWAIGIIAEKNQGNDALLEALGPLKEALNADDPRMREQAAWGIGNITGDRKTKHEKQVLEGLVREKYGKEFSAVYDLVDGNRNVEQIMEKTGFSEEKIIGIIEKMEKDGLITLEYPDRESAGGGGRARGK